MKKPLQLMLSVFLMFFFVVNLSAQDANELIIESMGDIYAIISSDTAADGSWNHDTYILRRGGVYLTQYEMLIERDISIIGEAEPKGTRPAMIMAKPDASGEFIYTFFNVYEDVTFTLKNLVVQGRTAEPNANNLSINKCLSVRGKRVRLIVDNCVFNSFENSTLYIGAEACYAKITNSKFRNCTEIDDDYSGNAIAEWGGPSWRDSLIVRNNTFVNMGADAVYVDNAVYEALVIDHNTFVGCLNAILSGGVYQQPNLTITNNIFVGGSTNGATALDNPIIVPERDSAAIISIDTIRNQDALAVMEDVMGVSHDDRYNQIHNNVNYFPPILVEAWKTLDYENGACHPQIFLSGYTKMMAQEFANIAVSNNIGHYGSWEALEEGSFDPQFKEGAIERVIQPMIDWEDAYRNNGEYAYWRNIDPEGQRFNLVWPLADDFSYSNPEMLTASTTGGPVGDLNWISGATGIRDFRVAGSDIEMSSYPNPFSGTTTIRYTLDKSSSVKLSVYDLTGKEVATLINSVQHSGTHLIEWDGLAGSGSSLPGGIYLYKIETGTHSGVQRMIKL